MQLPCTNAVLLHSVCVFIVGASQVALGLWPSKFGTVTCITIFGFFVACFSPTWSEVTMLMVGRKSYPLASGYGMLIMGIGWMAGAPVAGRKYSDGLKSCIFYI